MKVIRAVERYVESAKTEEYILKYISARDPRGDSKLVRLYEAFERKGNYCMIFERLGLSLYEILKKNYFIGFPIKYVQSFFRQILQAVNFMHSMQITHTDLKPENILVMSQKLVKQKIKFDESQCSINKYDDQETKIYLPQTDEIKLIDMGGATFDYDHHSSIINTRQYRAPEVILGCVKWDSSSDIWAIACIIIEIYSGDLYFQTRKSDLEHLAMIERACGPIPTWMVMRTPPPLNQYFQLDPDQFESNKSHFIWTKTQAPQDSLKRIEKLKQLEQLIREKNLVDLLRKLLVIDPTKRITCQQALKHQFFQENYN